MKRVVITGLGAVTPIGNNVAAYWENMLKGISGAAPITRFDAAKFRTQFACEVKGFDPSPFFERNDARKYDIVTQYAVAASEEAIAQAGIDFTTLNRDRIGVIWGGGDGGVSTFEEQHAAYVLGDGTPRFNPFFIPKRIVNIASGVISIRHGLRGVNYTTAAACSASNTAIIDAFNYIRWGKADMMITGGSEASVTPTSIGGFNASKALSMANDICAQASRPFDVARDGFVLGEGAGAIVLESYEHAVARGATILAEVLGGGLAADAYHLTGTHPDGDGAVLGMTLALQDAGLQPGDIDHINAHATSTPVGDISELRAIRRVFGERPAASISATKSMTGHLLGGAGAIEAIACIKSVMHDVIPPTINTVHVEPEFADGFDLALGTPRHRKVQYAMSNTFGFGGHIGCSVYGKFNG